MNRREFLVNTAFGFLWVYSPVMSLSRYECNKPDAITPSIYFEFDAKGNRYEMDLLNNRITKRSLDNTVNWSIGSKGNKVGQFDQPVSVMAGTTRIYILDHGNSRVQIFDQDGQFLTQFGKFGFNNGNLWNPKGKLIFHNDKFYICDTGNQRIQIFDAFGNSIDHIYYVDERNKPLPFYPGDMIKHTNNHFYVINNFTSSILIFDDKREYIHSFSAYGINEGQLINPCSITMDDSGNILVADSSEGYITIFDSDGIFIDRFQIQDPDAHKVIPVQIVAGPDKLIHVSTLPNLIG